MNNEQHSDTSQPPKTMSWWLKLAVVLIGLLVIFGAGYIGYLYAPKAESGGDASVVVDTGEVENKEQPVGDKYHTVLAAGYPYNTTKKMVIKLAVPSRLQSIAVASDNHDPGYTDILANKYNDEMGRWWFGNPALASPNSLAGDLSIIHISDDWLSETASAENIPSYDKVFGYNFLTPEKKSASLAQLDADTKKCVNDGEGGFTISNIINVCYHPDVSHHAVGSYSPILRLKGYGVLDGRQYVLFGFLHLNDGSRYSKDEAIKKHDDFTAGNIPEDTKNLITEYVEAPKNSTIAVEER